MSKFLCTFSGKYGDILWSLATVKRLYEMFGTKLDFACMPQYRSLLPLIQGQEYIDKAFVIEDWVLFHSNYGDQPWNPPDHTQCVTSNMGGYKCKAGWEQCWHLGYRQHPGRTMGGQELQLIDFIAWQQGVSFNGNPLPFLSFENYANKQPYVAVAFNSQYKELKLVFCEKLREIKPEVALLMVNDDLSDRPIHLPWDVTARVIGNAVGFVGCKSSNYVVAHGVNQRCIVYEPHPARNKEGHLGTVFGCSYGKELNLPLVMPPVVAAQATIDTIRQWLKEKANETT